jgi:NTP pyrophosphatase (non-canonical NTP hydrolase)
MNQNQQKVHEWVSQFKLGYFPPHEILARLTEENGEIAREINHLFGSKKKKASEDTAGLKAEIGDMLFTVCCLANSLDINLDEALNETIIKYNTRDEKRWEKK